MTARFTPLPLALLLCVLVGPLVAWGQASSRDDRDRTRDRERQTDPKGETKPERRTPEPVKPGRETTVGDGKTTPVERLTDEEREELERLRRIREYYPQRPELPTELQQYEYLLDEIENEAAELAPLYGQQAFRQAIIDRALGAESVNQPIATPPPSYRILPGDKLTITFWNKYVEPQQVPITVRPDGTIAFDPIGALQVSGMTRQRFEEVVTDAIRRKGPRQATVEFAFTALHALRVAVRGEVRRVTGNLILNGYATLFDALAAAGGPTGFASLRRIQLYRDGQSREIDLYEFLQTGDPAANVDLRDGDSLHVPVAELLVTVAGEVARPARYELTDDRTLRGALHLAGGLRGRAARVQVTRVADYAREALHDFPVTEVMRGTAETAAIEPLQHGDIITVQEVGAARDVVKIEGAVGSQGDYGYTPGMTLGELVERAQGILREGHVGIGTIRRPTPSGQIESINFEVSEVLADGAAAARELRPGDVVEIPLAEQRPPLTVFIGGAVNEPGTFRMQTAHSLSDLIQEAAGLAPGAASYGLLLSTRTGTQVETRLDLTPLARGGEPVPNPSLSNGDRVTVPFLADVGEARTVRVEGFVRTPGTVPLSEGMRISDLMQRAGGRLPKAATRAKLIRTVPGTAQTQALYIDLERAAAGDPEANLLLQEDDLLEVDSAAAMLAPLEPVVTISGPVGQPGQYARHVGMRVSDLLREAGGLRLEADRDQAYLSRLTEHGRARRIPIDPARAMTGDEQADLELRDRDVIEIIAWREITAAPPMVRASGSVYNPGPQDLTEGMTLEELLFLAGGPTPEAYLPRAELIRRTDDGRTRTVPFDLTMRPLTMPLRDGDELRVYTHEQVNYRDPTVEIKGEVQRPGRYERTDQMMLSDLLFRAGGLTRNPAFVSCEVARSRDTQTVVLQPNIGLLLKGDTTQDVELRDGDRVFVQTQGDYLEEPREVLVRGRVNLPGFFPISSRDETLRQLVVERARGITVDAFVDGAILLRRVDEVVNPEVARYGNEIFAAIRAKRRRDDYALILSRGVETAPTWLGEGERVIPTEVVQSHLAGDLGAGQDQTRLERELELMERSRYTSVANLQPQTDSAPDLLRHYVRVSLDLRSILEGRADLDLRPNDILVVPETPELILVQGEVASNLAQPFVEGQTVSHYLAQAGGLTRDADVGSLLVVRASGNLTQAAGNTLIRRGDMILVPPAPLVIPRDRAPLEAVQTIASILGGFATTLIAITQSFR